MSETAEATNEATKDGPSNAAQNFLEATIEHLTNIDSQELKEQLHAISKSQWESYKNSFIDDENSIIKGE
jgi:hypothetical protein